jgi:RND family efflux transporter MFP subunit
VTVGDAATLSLLSMPGRPFAGNVARVAGSLHTGTRTMQVEIDLPNDDRALLPGMFGEVTIVLDEHQALVLPASAVRYDEAGNAHVYVVDGDDRVQVVDVSTGLDDGQEIEITAGLEGVERVVGSTIGRIRPGTLARVRD